MESMLYIVPVLIVLAILLGAMRDESQMRNIFDRSAKDD